MVRGLASYEDPRPIVKCGLTEFGFGSYPCLEGFSPGCLV